MPEQAIPTPAASGTATADPKSKAPKKKPADTSTFAGYVADLPEPFRPRHLTEAIRLHAAEHNITGKALADIDPHKFLKDHGLPNPLRRWRVGGKGQKKEAEPAEFEAVDASEAVRQFALLRGIKETHQWSFQSFLLDY